MTREYETEDDYEMIPLQDEELNEELKNLSGWKEIRNQWIGCEYIFDNYMKGIDFAKEIGEYAEKRQHHPSIKIDYKKVSIEISSWRAKGVTAIDIEMAQDFNAIYERLNEDFV